MLIKKFIIVSIFFALMITLGLAFRPVPPPSSENLLRTDGTIEEVFSTGNDGIAFKLKGDTRTYYLDLDQGIKHKLQLITLREELPGKSAEIYYVRHWTPIDPLSRRKHIAKVEVNKATVYSVFK